MPNTIRTAHIDIFVVKLTVMNKQPSTNCTHILVIIFVPRTKKLCSLGCLSPLEYLTILELKGHMTQNKVNLHINFSTIQHINAISCGGRMITRDCDIFCSYVYNKSG